MFKPVLVSLVTTALFVLSLALAPASLSADTISGAGTISGAVEATDDATADSAVKSSRLEVANRAFFNGDYETASKFCLSVLHGKSGKNADHPDDLPECKDLHSMKKQARAAINLGICYLGMKQANKAEPWFNHASKLLNKMEAPDGLAIGDYLAGLGECHYMQGRSKQSLREYSEAISFYQQKLGRWHPETVPALEGLAGSHFVEGSFQTALPIYEQIARVDLIHYGPSHTRFGLSLNNLAEVYYQLAGCKQSRKMFEHAMWIFKHEAAERLYKSVEDEGDAAQVAVMKKRIKEAVIGLKELPDFKTVGSELLQAKGFDPTQQSFAPRPNDFDNWRLARRNAEETTYVAIDPKVEQKALILCLHGLGLHCKSFDDFAKKIAPYGYTVVALDVRGFGSFAMEKGLDKLDLNAGMEDLSATVELVKEHNPELPIVLLGESMGGALALQITARHPDVVSALISAVPSGKRFKSAKTNFLVGLRLLEDKKKPIQIGKKVIEQSTADAGVREVWMNDPGNRMQLSAEELVRFQDFMRDTEKYAKDIKNTPVIIFQGFKDHLVKPEGTIALYGSLKTPHKDLVLVGASEHLIFEEGQVPDDIVRMLSGWLDSHLKPRTTMVAAPEKAVESTMD